MKYEIKTLRPSGEIETVITDKFSIITPEIERKMRATTKDAGSGDILSFTPVEIKKNIARIFKCSACMGEGNEKNVEIYRGFAYHRGCSPNN